MRKGLAIARRELNASFRTPLSYVLLAGFLAATGFSFSLMVQQIGPASLRSLFDGPTLVILLVIVPLMTMHLFAGERKNGTLELLLTSPIKAWEIVAGKFLASLGLFLIMLLFSLLYVVLMATMGGADWGAIITSYLGAVFMGGSFLAVGTLISALCRSPLYAALLSFTVLMTAWFSPHVGQAAGGFAGKALTYIGPTFHLSEFAKGVVDTRSIIYFSSLILGALYLAARSLEMRQ